jgi:GNAT superfamily N-acetyltransferase
MLKAKTINAPKPLAEFSGDLLLRDGASLCVRAPHVGDCDKVNEMFARCSPETIRYRFLYSLRSLSKDLLDRLVKFDGAHYIALFVTQGESTQEQIVAIGQYCALDERPDVAEVSFLVEDAMQGRGIGTALLILLAKIAYEHGITRFAADVLADNHQMLSVFHKAGYALSSTSSYGVTHLEFPITPSEVAPAQVRAPEDKRAPWCHLQTRLSVA